MATNSRARQNREIDKGLEIINKDIIKHNRNNNKILFANSSELDNNFTGLVAMRLASQYSKPCILIRETAKKNGYYAGSMRNFNGSPIKDLKTFLEDTKLFDFIQGHQFAAGVGLKKENIAKVILETNKLLQDVDFDKYYNVDFIFEPQDITIELVEKIDKLKNMWGNNVDEPLILIKNIHLNTNNIDRLGANKDTLKLLIKEEDDIQISAIKFKCLSDEPLMEKIENNPIGIDIKLNIICKLSMNIFNSISQPQAMIIDYQML
jgi:single-stranded-DNA-specific exonuclease